MIHDRLDLARWKSLFALERLRDEAQARGKRLPAAGDLASDPSGIAVLEQLREASYAHLPNVERVPTDLFVWNRGETERREVTKIGGLPYRAPQSPHPVDRASSCSFLAVARSHFAPCEHRSLETGKGCIS